MNRLRAMRSPARLFLAVARLSTAFGATPLPDLFRCTDGTVVRTKRGETVAEINRAYHAHHGLHYLAEIDWRMFMDFADRHLRNDSIRRP